MKKHIVVGLLAISFILSPVFVNAQTLQQDQINTLIRLLQSLVQLLQQQLLTLQRQSPITQTLSPQQQVDILRNLNNSNNYVSMPVAGDVWTIGQPQYIRLARGINANFPLTSGINVVLAYEKEESGVGGTINCVKQASNQTEFIWNDGNTLMNFCGAASYGKYKNVLPGRYKIKFIMGNPSQTVIAESGVFSIVGTPIPIDTSSGKQLGG